MENLLNASELEVIKNLIIETESLPGEIAEVGVYQGSSASIILENTQKKVWLFDTFKGLVEDDVMGFTKGQFPCDMDTVDRNLKGRGHYVLVKGVFPETGEYCTADRFSFTHIDCDTFPSITKSFDFFWPKMSRGGWIVIHDCHPQVLAYVREKTGYEIPEDYQCKIQKK